jgi:hypothetical protein
MIPMDRKFLIYLFPLLIGLIGPFVLWAQPKDSIKIEKKPMHWRLTARLHSQAIFNYGGRLATENPSFDINFMIEKNNWGFLFFKGMDLYDHYTFYNFSLISVYRNFKLSNKITFTPYVGSFLEQEQGVADHGSDAVVILITSAKLHPQLSFEYMSLFGNLILVPEQRDWVNRFRLSYVHRHWDVVSTAWWNNNAFDKNNYWTSGLSVAYSGIKAREHLFFSVGMSGLYMLHTSDVESNPYQNALVITLSAQFLK